MPLPKPGRGWKRFPGTGVFEHLPTGTRIHLHGVIRFANGDVEDACAWPRVKRRWWHARCAGGNQRRGLMTYALERHTERSQQ